MLDTINDIQRKISRYGRQLVTRHMDKLLNFYPPYLGAGIQVAEMSDDYRRLVVEMSLKTYNQNYVGTHFGGSLYSMCDPFYMLMLLQNLGNDYIVWDRAATIDFVRPGRGTVHAEFILTEERIEEIRRQADEQHKVEPVFEVDVVDEDGEVVARVEKILYVRRKDRS